MEPVVFITAILTRSASEGERSWRYLPRHFLLARGYERELDRKIDEQKKTAWIRAESIC